MSSFSNFCVQSEIDAAFLRPNGRMDGQANSRSWMWCRRPHIYQLSPVMYFSIIFNWRCIIFLPKGGGAEEYESFLSFPQDFWSFFQALPPRCLSFSMCFPRFLVFLQVFSQDFLLFQVFLNFFFTFQVYLKIFGLFPGLSQDQSQH